jgi:hypothetical protein
MRNRNERPKRPLTQKALQSFKLVILGKAPKPGHANPLFLKAHMDRFQGLPYRPN